MRVIKIADSDEIPKNYTGIAEYVDGSKHWYLNGEFHREDGPAVEVTNGSKHWFLNGKYHREDGPAYESADGSKFWYLNGKFLLMLPPESQPFVFIEEFIDKEDGPQIKVLTQQGTEIWPNIVGLKELADNWEKKYNEVDKG